MISKTAWMVRVLLGLASNLAVEQERVGREYLDLAGKLTSRLYGFLKRRPRIRRAAVAAFMAVDRALARPGGQHGEPEGQMAVEPSTRCFVQRFAGSEGGSQASWREVQPAEHIRNVTAGGLHNFIDREFAAVLDVAVPPAFVATIPNGRVVGEHGAVMSSDGALLGDLSTPIGDLRAHILGANGSVPDPTGLAVDVQGRPRRLRGSAAVLSVFAGRNYFHWLFDVLPRLGLIMAAGIDLARLNAFIVPSHFARFQIETLHAFGISRRRTVSSFVNRHLVADELVAPSLPRPTGVVPAWVCEFLRSSFLPVRPADGASYERIYIVRKVTDHGLLAQEEALTRRLAQHGFQPLAMERYTIGEKAWLMDKAEIVIGPSGGGMCNIVFCRPGTKIVELRVQPFPVMEAWDIANRIGLSFYDVLPEGYGDARRQAVARGSIGIDAVFETLEFAGCLG